MRVLRKSHQKLLFFRRVLWQWRCMYATPRESRIYTARDQQIWQNQKV